jgi:hypothetical protein
MPLSQNVTVRLRLSGFVLKPMRSARILDAKCAEVDLTTRPWCEMRRENAFFQDVSEDRGHREGGSLGG